MPDHREPVMIFDFVDGPGRLVFSKPVKIIVADSVDQVVPTIREVERFVNHGYYAAGYVSYEAAPAFDSAMAVASRHSLPLVWFGIFENPSNQARTHPDGVFRFEPWRPTIGQETYSNAISRIKNSISRGQTYQVNYTMRLQSRFSGDDLGAYHHLLQAQQAGYSAYLNIGRYSILSFSPELFFRLQDRDIVTRPMKGTAKRGRWPEEDKAYAMWLRSSEKNQAENVMIVDLLRNDLNRIAEVGSVHVPRLFEIESYPTVHQMTSTVSAKVRTDRSLTDVFRALFPCGSITGAPKISTMKLISELEDNPREVYCGTIGYIQPNGQAVFNVAIRTVILDGETGFAEYGTGGGITWDSVDTEEYNEALTKADFLEVEYPSFELLETMKFDGEQFILLERHLERLARSAQYFGITVDMNSIMHSLQQHAEYHQSRERRVRLLVSQTGDARVESSSLNLPSDDSLPVRLAQTPISSENKFLYHKTTYRSMYELYRAQKDHVFDTLLWNESGELTEFTNGNIVVQIGGLKLTPPIQSGLLPGTFRAQLLAEGVIEERTLTRRDVESAEKMWFINSVRGWVQVYLTT